MEFYYANLKEQFTLRKHIVSYIFVHIPLARNVNRLYIVGLTRCLAYSLLWLMVVFIDYQE